MTKGKSIVEQWKVKPKGRAPCEAEHAVAPGSSQLPPSLHSNTIQQPQPPAEPQQYHSVVTDLANCRLDAGPVAPGAAHLLPKVKPRGDADADTVAGRHLVVKEPGVGIVDMPIEGHEKKEEVMKSKKLKGAMAIPREVKGSMAHAQLRATFYPKFENEKSDQEVRLRMQEVVSSGLGILESRPHRRTYVHLTVPCGLMGRTSLQVTLKHSGSLFLYSGDNGGAFAKNSYGNLYTAVGVFVLGQTLKEAWGAWAGQKQRELNAYLKEHHMCIGMELVTAVLGDHGQRPLQDYVVVTAVTNLDGRPHFQSTPDVVAFCHQWRLPTNHYWLFSTRSSVSSFFAAYDALCEEGLARTVTKTLNEVADMTLPATRSHEEIQGEILEGLVARIVTPESASQLNEVLVKFPRPPSPETPLLAKGLREIFSANRDRAEKQVEALLKAVGPEMCSDLSDWVEDGVSEVEANKKKHPPMLENFLHSTPVNNATKKLQEMIQVIHKSKLPVRFKCRTNMTEKISDDHDHILSQFKMTIHVLSDSAFRRYQKEMRKHPGLWPLYRGFFVDVHLYDEGAPSSLLETRSLAHGDDEETRGKSDSGQDDSCDETENLMLKLKFLPYKIRTFLIRNGIRVLFEEGIAEYKEYYRRQMKIWGTSPEKQRELNKLLSEWAHYIRERTRGKKLSGDTYLTDAEPFLKQFAKRSPKNQKLVGAAGVDINVDEFLAQAEVEQDLEDDYVSEDEHAIALTIDTPRVAARKAQGILVFFPGIPGCAKSALCREIMTSPDGLGSGLGIHSLMGDLVKGRYWPKLEDERVKMPKRITLADKNAPNNDVWQPIQRICKTTQAVGVPVVPESEGTENNPYSLDVMAIFIYRVLQRTNHPGRLDKNTPNPGYVLLMFYNLYNGMDREEFEEELLNKFGHLVKIPVLKPNRAPMPDPVVQVIEDGLDLFRHHTNKHGRLGSLHGSLKENWATWEIQLKSVLSAHSEHLIEVQVPFQEVVRSVQQQLQDIANGEFEMHVPVDKEERSFKTFRFVAIALSPNQVLDVLQEVSVNHPQTATVLKKKTLQGSLVHAHITLAHKHSHGVAEVAAYGPLRGTEAQVQLTAILFSEELAALEVSLAESGENAVSSKNEWPHVTVWTASGVSAKEANKLPEMVKAGTATRLELKPTTLTGKINFF